MKMFFFKKKIFRGPICLKEIENVDACKTVFAWRRLLGGCFWEAAPGKLLLGGDAFGRLLLGGDAFGKGQQCADRGTRTPTTFVTRS